MEAQGNLLIQSGEGTVRKPEGTLSKALKIVEKEEGNGRRRKDAGKIIPEKKEENVQRSEGP